MKKLFLLMGMAAAMFSFAGCQENEIDGGAALNGEGSTFEIVAGIDQDATKTTLTDKDVEWEEGDVIYVVTSEGPWGLPYQEDNAGTSIAEYTYADGKFTSSATIENGEYEFLAMYTNQKSYHRQDASSHQLAKEQSQNCADPTAHIKANDALVGVFSAEIPMDAPAEVTMKHLYTMMQVDIKNNTGAAVEIKRFEMKAAGADLAGVFYVEDFYDAVITTKQNPSETVAVNVTGGSVASGATLPVYFVMAPISGYTGDVTFKVTDASGNTYSKTVAMTDITFEAGKYNTTPYAISTPDKVEAKELPFEESFDSSLGEFTKEEQLPEGLTYVWSHDASHKYAKASAYVSGTRYEQTSYLVSPVLDLTNVENAKVQFDHTGNYFNGTETTSANLCIREVGGDWETIEIPTYWSQNWAWVNSGDIDISKFAGKLIQIGFRYSSTEDIAGTWEIKNVSVTAQAAATELIVAPVEMTVDATGGVASVTYSIVNPKEGTSISATADVDWIESFDYSTSGQVKFNVAANETTDVRTGVVTISYEGAVSVPVAIAQKGKVAADTEEVTIDLTAQGYANGAEVASVSKDQVTVTFDKGDNSNSPKFYTTGSAVRVYGGSLFTVSISSGSIVGIELTYGTGDGTNAITTDSGNFETSLWSGSAQSVTFTVGGTSGNRRIQKIKVLYKNDGSIPEPAVLTSIAVENPKTEYTVGDAFEKPTVKATYSDNSTKTVSDVSFSGYDMTKTGEQTVEVSYTESGVTVKTSYDITVSAAVADDTDYSGTYAIVAYRNTSTEQMYYYLTNEVTTGSTKRLVAEAAGTECPVDGVEVNKTKLWTLTKSGNIYTVQSAASGGFISWSSGNSATLSESGLEFTIAKEEDGTYLLQNEERYLSLNTTAGTNYFAMYAGTQTQNLYLIKAIEGEEAVPELTGITVNATKTTFTVGDEFAFEGTVTANYSNGTTEDVTTSAAFSGYDMSQEGPQTITVTYEGKTATYDITVNPAQSGGENKKFVKVTSAPSDWSGTYLIVYEDGKVAFDGGRDVLDAVGNTVNVNISDNKIEANDATNAASFTINASGHIQSASGYYIGQTSNANGLKSNETTKYTNTLSLNSDGTVNIVSGGAYLRYNAASDQTRFRYYKSSSYTGQKAIALYKLQ